MNYLLHLLISMTVVKTMMQELSIMFLLLVDLVLMVHLTLQLKHLQERLLLLV